MSEFTGEILDIWEEHGSTHTEKPKVFAKSLACIGRDGELPEEAFRSRMGLQRRWAPVNSEGRLLDCHTNVNVLASYGDDRIGRLSANEGRSQKRGDTLMGN